MLSDVSIIPIRDDDIESQCYPNSDYDIERSVLSQSANSEQTPLCIDQARKVTYPATIKSRQLST